MTSPAFFSGDVGETVDLAHTSPWRAPGFEPPASFVVAIGGSEPQILRAPLNGSWLIGRGSEVDVRFDGEAISRKHARLSFTDGRVELVDLGSQNGTSINGRRVAGSEKLASMDVVSVGHASLIVCACTESPAIAHVYNELARLADSELPVHIFGETGTGKELAARAVHAWSRRAAHNFVAINCAALPEQLIESELFGHEKGAFSGAHATKLGVFEAADGGALARAALPRV